MVKKKTQDLTKKELVKELSKTFIFHPITPKIKKRFMSRDKAFLIRLLKSRRKEYNVF